jgi:thioredoxin-related protein
MYKLLYTFFWIVTIPYFVHAQSIKFSSSSIKTLMAKSEKKKKLIFVDTYADWCAPCKMMEKDIFPQKTVRNFYNKKFICTKIDMESPLGEEFSTKHKVQSIPTFYFLNSRGNVIYKKVGGTKDAEKFVEYGQTAQDIYLFKLTGKEIKKPTSILHYAYFLKEIADTNYNYYLHQFLATQSDWAAPENMQIILDLAEKENSPALEYFIENIDSFSAKLGESPVAEKRLLLILDRSIEYLKATPKGQEPDLEGLMPVFEKYYGINKYLSHFILFQFRYYQQSEDYPNMRLVLRRFIDEVVVPMPDNRDKAIEYINTATVYYEATEGLPKHKAEAIQWGEKAIELDQGADIYSILAVLCEDAGFTEKASLYRQKANEAKRKD